MSTSNGDKNNTVTLKTSNGDKNKTLTLKTSNGETFEVEVSVISQSKTIKHMIEDGCAADDFIPVPNVEGKVLAQVIEDFKKHYKSGDANDDEKAKKEIHEWDIEFMNKMDMNSLCALVLAANYLDNKGLLDLTAQKIANDIKDYTVEEVQKVFNIQSDFAPGELEKLKKEHGENP